MSWDKGPTPLLRAETNSPVQAHYPAREGRTVPSLFVVFPSREDSGKNAKFLWCQDCLGCWVVHVLYKLLGLGVCGNWNYVHWVCSGLRWASSFHFHRGSWMWQYCELEKESESENVEKRPCLVITQEQSSRLAEDPGSVPTFRRKEERRKKR